jgi:uncharacterized protein
MSWLELILVALAGVAGGLVNALAGGGTLITFPVLVAVGLPAVAANVTNTVALSPGYLGATFGQAKDLQGQKRRLWLLFPASVIGGLIGGVLLLMSGERLFSSLVPYLILLAAGLLSAADTLRAWLLKRSAGKSSTSITIGWALSQPGQAAGVAQDGGRHWGCRGDPLLASLIIPNYFLGGQDDQLSYCPPPPLFDHPARSHPRG